MGISATGSGSLDMRIPTAVARSMLITLSCATLGVEALVCLTTFDWNSSPMRS